LSDQSRSLHRLHYYTLAYLLLRGHKQSENRGRRSKEEELNSTSNFRCHLLRSESGHLGPPSSRMLSINGERFDYCSDKGKTLPPQEAPSKIIRFLMGSSLPPKAFNTSCPTIPPRIAVVGGNSSETVRAKRLRDRSKISQYFDSGGR
jgi:hypothetical protein